MNKQLQNGSKLFELKAMLMFQVKKKSNEARSGVRLQLGNGGGGSEQRSDYKEPLAGWPVGIRWTGACTPNNLSGQISNR